MHTDDDDDDDDEGLSIETNHRQGEQWYLVKSNQKLFSKPGRWVSTARTTAPHPSTKTWSWFTRLGFGLAVALHRLPLRKS